jgi:hypothetical protein
MALCTLDQVKQHFGFGDNAQDEEELERLITVAQGLFEQYCGRKFDEATFTEYWNGDGTDLLFVKNYPIISITSIHDDTGDHTYGASTLIDPTTYAIINDNHVQMYASLFNKGVNNIKIVYVAGYSDETVGTHVPIPKELRQACIAQVGWMFKQGEGFQYGVNTKTLDDGSIGFIETSALLPSVRETLRLYRRVSY